MRDGSLMAPVTHTSTPAFQSPAIIRDEWARSSPKKLNLGKSCVRFGDLDDVPLDLIGRAVTRYTPEEYVARVSSAQRR